MANNSSNTKLNQETFLKQKTEKLFTVSEITREIRTSLEYDFSNIGIVGEISNIRKPRSGHVYLTLKD